MKSACKGGEAFQKSPVLRISHQENLSALNFACHPSTSFFTTLKFKIVVKR